MTSIESLVEELIDVLSLSKNKASLDKLSLDKINEENVNMLINHIVRRYKLTNKDSDAYKLLTEIYKHNINIIDKQICGDYPLSVEPFYYHRNYDMLRCINENGINIDKICKYARDENNREFFKQLDIKYPVNFNKAFTGVGYNITLPRDPNDRKNAIEGFIKKLTNDEIKKYFR